MRREDTVHNGHMDQGAYYLVHISCNETPRGSWRAELTLGPADHIIVDGRSAAHAVQHLLTVLPAALAARLQQSEAHTLPTMQAFHPSEGVVFLQVPSLAEVDTAIVDLLRRGRGGRDTGGDRRPPVRVSPSHTGIAALGLSGTIVP